MIIPRLVIASLLTSTLAAQTVLFEDNFNSYTVDEPISSPWGSVTPNPSVADAKLEVVQDTSDLFGQGTSNQVLHVLDQSDTERTRGDIRDLSFDVATLTFDFYEVAGVTGTPFRIGIGLNSSSYTSTAFLINLQDGNPGSYTQDAVHKIQIVVNTSASGVDYYQSNNVASLTYDLWIDGVLVTDNGGLSDGSTIAAGTDLTAFRFTTDTGGLSQEMYIDNLKLYDGAFIPEPSTWGLAGIFALLGIVLHKRRAR